jgi:hypothetical protein
MPEQPAPETPEKKMPRPENPEEKQPPTEKRAEQAPERPFVITTMVKALQLIDGVLLVASGLYMAYLTLHGSLRAALE